MLLTREDHLEGMKIAIDVIKQYIRHWFPRQGDSKKKKQPLTIKTYLLSLQQLITSVHRQKVLKNVLGHNIRKN